MASSDSIELKLISCRDLKSFNFFQKISAYAVVSLRAGDRGKEKPKQIHKTPADKKGEGHPEWNDEIRFRLDEFSQSDRDRLFLEFDLRCEGIFSDKTIGEVHVPLSDLIGECDGVARFVGYQVRDGDGKPNGSLNFFCKVNLKGKIVPAVSPTPAETLPEQAPLSPRPWSYLLPPSPPPAYYPLSPEFYPPPPPAFYPPPPPDFYPPPPPDFYSPPPPAYYPPPPPSASGYSLPMPFYRAPEKETCCTDQAGIGYGYHFDGYPTIEVYQQDDTWQNRSVYPILEQSEPSTDMTCRRGEPRFGEQAPSTNNMWRKGLYPTVG